VSIALHAKNSKILQTDTDRQTDKHNAPNSNTV